MSKNKLYLIIISIAYICFACTEIIEKPLTNEKVIVIAPGDGVKTAIYTQTFWWQELTGASGYNLQIVQNKFDSLPIFKLDTITSKTKFTLTLRPGQYQWRVLGVNANGKSEKYSLQKLQIDSTSLGIQTQTLNSPLDLYKTNSTNLSLIWESIFGASSYRLLIARNDSSLVKTTQNKLTYSYTIPKDGTYTWKVKALSSKDSTDWSETRSFTLDTKIDSTKLVSPKNNTNINISTANGSLTLDWTKVNTADNLTLNISRERQNTTTTTYSKTFSASETPQVLFKNLNIPILSGDVIKWSITSSDGAGNEAKTSTWLFNIL